MTRAWKICAAALPCLLGLAPLAAQDHQAAEPYQRISEDRGGAVVKLEMAVREFTPSKPGQPKIFMAAAVHIGEKQFYESLQAFLDQQDVVLFEGVKPPGAGSLIHEDQNLSDEARAAATKRRIRFIAIALRRYQGDDGRLPATLEALAAHSEARVGSLIKESITDAWGRELVFKFGEEARDLKNRFDVVSLGADGQEGGEGAAADLKFSDQKPLRRSEVEEGGDGLQAKLAQAMGLVFQLDAMDHNKPNWRNSDLSIDQVQARLDKSGGSDMILSALDGSSMIAKFANVILAVMSASPESRATMRLMMIEMLSKADQLMDQMPGGMGPMMKVILDDRNAVVIGDLKKVLAGEPAIHTIAIIYGAGHLPGLERILVDELGYTPSGDRWRAAMKVDAKEVGMTAAQLTQMRRTTSRMIQRQLDAVAPTKRDE